MTETIFLTSIFLLETLLFYFLPTINGQQTLFGIVLKVDDFQAYGLPILQKYRRDLIVIALFSLIAFYLVGTFSINSLLIAYIPATIAILFPLFRYSRQTWQLRDKRTFSRLATPLKPRYLRDFSNVWTEIIIVSLTIMPFGLLAFYYPQLPDSIPIHWNLAGEPDGWAKKSFFPVFFPALLTAYLQLFWIILKQDIIQARFRVPAEQAERVLSLKEISLRANVGAIDWCRLICGILLGGVSLMVLSPILSVAVVSAMNAAIWANLILLLAGLTFYIYRMILASREIKSLTGQITFQTSDEMEGWTDGLFYYNANDTAFMLEKPGGVGYTINFAHKRAVIYLMLILLPEVILVLSLIF